MSTILLRSFLPRGVCRLLPLATIICALTAHATAHAGLQELRDDDAQRSDDAPGPLARFLAEHGAHLLLAVGTDYAAKIYSDSVGPSRDPLLFSSAGVIDTWVRDEVAGPSRERGFIEQDGLEALKLAVPLALAGINIGNGEAMARDLVGYAELYFMKRAIVRFAKDVIGRERPPLEFASEDGLGPKKTASLDARDGNHQSFPSGHASGSFAWAGYLERAIARKVGMRAPARAASFTTLYGLAGYISWSRLRRDKHFFSDVVAGAATGIGVSRYYYRLNHPDEYPPASDVRSGASRFKLMPPMPVPGGMILMLEVRLGHARPSPQ